MIALILAGGFGTRIKDVVKDIPKPMAPINGTPFLTYLLELLHKNSISEAILCTGYKHEVIEKYYGNSYKDMKISYSVEQSPLGTGGAIKKGLKNTNEENVFIINGDTYYEVNLKAMMQKHLEMKSDITMALKPMKNFDRYGSVKVKDEKILAFNEKKHTESGLINGGISIINKNIFSKFTSPKKFSFESELLEKELNSMNVSAHISDTYFIDIGIPEDYYKAQRDFVSINITGS